MAVAAVEGEEVEVATTAAVGVGEEIVDRHFMEARRHMGHHQAMGEDRVAVEATTEAGEAPTAVVEVITTTEVKGMARQTTAINNNHNIALPIQLRSNMQAHHLQATTGMVGMVGMGHLMEEEGLR